MFFQNRQLNHFAILKREESYINQNYDFLNCSIHNKVLKVTGSNKPSSKSPTYEFKIIYDIFNSSPKVFITNPIISFNDDIHIYPKDNSLCLYHRTDLIWDVKKHNLYDTIIPWTIEWILFYELYLITGKWHHPFVPHHHKKQDY